MISINTKLFIPLSFFLFICGVIYLADTADYNFAFRMVGHIPYGDKIMHALLYGMMAMFLNYGLSYRSFRGIPVAALWVLGFAILEEITQYWIPSRTFDLGDIAADIVGVSLLVWVRFSSQRELS